MKYLIGEDCKVSMKGEAVTTSKLSDDFTYDTDDKPLAVASMKEIAKVNKFNLKAKSTADIKKEFDKALSKLDLPEKREMSQSEKVQKLVKEMHGEKKTEDEILVAIVQNGVKFQAAAKMMKQALIDLGLSISSKDRYEKSKGVMAEGEFEPETYDEVAAMAKKIAEEVPSTSEKQAIAQIRKYCKEQEIEVPKKPKESVPFNTRMLAWIVLNVEGKDADDFEEFLDDNERSEKFIESQSKKFTAIKEQVAKIRESEKPVDPKPAPKPKGKGKGKGKK